MERVAPLQSNIITFGGGPTAEENYNKLNICYRICFKFVALSNKPDTCVCQRSVSDPVHDKRNTGAEGATWTMEHNTVLKPNPKHGQLRSGAWFTQMASDTPLRKVEQILFDVWEIPKPRLIMSILGDAENFTLIDRLEANFINSIIEVARSSEAWLVTNGYNVGIVQVVGQAIKKAALTDRRNKLVAIGVCKWGSVKNIEQLTVDPPVRNDQAERELVGEDKGKGRRGERDLEINHTHYLMLDDGRLRYCDTEDYRTDLCLQIAKYHDEHSFPIPVVTIVAEGGKDTIKNMYYDLRANIPVVIIDGSGRVAGFFKRWLVYTKEMDNNENDRVEAYHIENIGRATTVDKLLQIDTKSNQTRTDIRLELRNSEHSLMGIFRHYEVQLRSDLQQVLSQEDDLKRSTKANKTTGLELEDDLKRVMYCLQPAVRSSISIFNLDTDTSLSETIFRSICKARQKYIGRKEAEQEEVDNKKQQKSKPKPDETSIKRHVNSQQDVNKKGRNAQRTLLLQLAMDWNCIDVAKELILKNSLDNILNQPQNFMYALKKNLPTFIYEFLKLGIRPAHIFFYPRDPARYKKFFRELYPDDFKKIKTNHLSSFIKTADERSAKKIENADELNTVLRSIIGDYMHELYFYSDVEERQYTKLHALRELRKQLDRGFNNQLLPEEDDLVMRDLFIWAILYNYIDMAKVFLAHIKYRVCAALIATKILKQYHSTASHGDLKAGYMKSATYFEQYAIDCINQCEMHDPSMACEIVLQQIDLFGYVTCLQVAADADDKLFIATPCCVQAMNNIWNDKADPEQSSTRVRLSTVAGFVSLGFLGPLFIKYRAETTNKENKLERRLKSCGIDYSDPYPLEYPHHCHGNVVFNQYLHRFINFHRVPRMKYLYHALVYFLFLLLFSYVLLFKFQIPTNQSPSIDWTEILTIILVACMLIEETHYFCTLDSLTFVGKFFSYFQNLLKLMTLLSFVLFFIGLILRFAVTKNDVDFTAARIVMAIALEIFWLRSLAFIIVVPSLGPHLVAIGKMLKDLLFFMCIIAVVMTGYGVASRSMVYYPHKADYVPYNASLGFDGRSIFRDIVYPVYYMMYGNVGPELSNLDQTPDASYAIVTHVLLAIHVLFVNILLTNLLIAMFSKRFDQVYDETKNIWHSQQYLLTREYHSRAPLIPPFSVFYDTYRLIRMGFFRIRKACNSSDDPEKKAFKMIAIKKEQVDEWGAFEGASTYEYAHTHAKESRVNATASTVGSDARAIDKTEETGSASMASKDSADDTKKLQEDLLKVNVSLDEIKQQLSLLIAKSNAASSNESRQRTTITSEQNRT